MNIGNVQVRQARLSEMTAVRSILLQVFDDPLDRPTRSFLELLWHIPNSIMLIADLDGELVGFCYGVARKETFLASGLAVLPDFQRTGVGKKLYLNLLKEAQTRGLKECIAVIEPQNRPFFDKLNCEIIGEKLFLRITV